MNTKEINNYKALIKDVPKVFAIKDKFESLAEHIVDTECVELDGTKLIGKARDSIVFEKSYDMAIGCLYGKKKYIAIGCVAGIAIASITLIGAKSIKKNVTGGLN